MALWLGWLITLLLLYIGQLAVILILERRRQAYMAAWLFTALVCPFIGFVAYLIVGRAVLSRRRQGVAAHKAARLQFASNLVEIVADSDDMGNKQLQGQSKLHAMLSSLAPFPITKRNRSLALTNGAEAYTAILEQLERARHHIHFEFYTIRDDGVGTQFLEVLTRQARKGVEVRVLYDGIGSLGLDETYIGKLHEAGARTGCFSPPRLSFCERRINNRNHRKIVVVDGKTGFLGGMNIGDEYVGKDRKLGFWRDTHLRLEGDSVYCLQELFLNDWELAVNEKLKRSTYMPLHQCDGDERVLIVSDIPGYDDPNIVEILFAAITAARSSVYAVTPYFIPDPSIAACLRTAARSGIDVRIIIPHIADSEIVMLASLSYVQEMLDAGVRIFRYEKGFVHSKVLIVDRQMASVGSANLDMRSMYSNYELNAFLFDEAAIDRLKSDFMKDLRDSSEIDREAFRARSWKQKIGEEIAHVISPLM